MFDQAKTLQALIWRQRHTSTSLFHMYSPELTFECVKAGYWRRGAMFDAN